VTDRGTAHAESTDCSDEEPGAAESADMAGVKRAHYARVRVCRRERLRSRHEANGMFKQLAIGRSTPRSNLFSTDAQLASRRYAVRKDPEGAFVFQKVLFVTNKPEYHAPGPQYIAILDKASSLLTEPRCAP
jgi:hypothetical protein